MALLQIHNKENEIILNTPNRNEILKEGPPQTFKCNILGRGAYGTVFKAIFRARQVAVKIVKNAKTSHLQSLHSEANILGWRHRNIVKILKIESTQSFGIVIMERFSGQSLQAILDAVEVPLLHRVFISLDILAALMYCHKRGLLHLDVKPQNVLVSLEKDAPIVLQHSKNINQRNYICKLCDFGSSMKINCEKEALMKGNAKGTVRYMSPEALREESLSPAADIYSFGITMWQMEHRHFPYSWIQCNEIVAYQVVKNHLRPDSVKALMNGLALRKCCCESVTALSYISRSCGQLGQLDEHINYSECAAPQKSRRPFQDVNVKLNAVKRNLSGTPELGLMTPVTEQPKGSHGIENINWAVIFKNSDCIDAHQRAAYRIVYKSCWHTDSYSRPTSSVLRERLLHLI